MRLVGRILVVLAGAGLPAVVIAIGCNVEPDPYPAIGDGPNGGRAGKGSSGHAASAGATSGSSSSASGSSSSGGAAPNLCQCAWSFAGHGDAGTCQMCGTTAASAGGACAAQGTACSNDPLCVQALICEVSCPDSNPACPATCLTKNATFEALVACKCSHCSGSCGGLPPLPCDLDGGNGDGGDGGDAAQTGDAPSDG